MKVISAVRGPVVVALLVLACGGRGIPERGGPGEVGSPTSAATIRFVDVIASKDVAAIESALHAPLAYAGIAFADPSCAEQFRAARMIEADQRRAFAGCLATLRVRRSERRDSLFEVALLEDESGIELAARFAFVENRAVVVWIGHSGGRDPGDPLPSITPATLAGLRTDGATALTAESVAALERDRASRPAEPSYAWLKVCLDPAGALARVDPVLVSSPGAQRVFTSYVRTWTLRPFTVGGQPIPACALIKLQHPASGTVEHLPVPIPLAADGLRVAITALKRLEGETRLVPSSSEKIRIQMAGSPVVAGSFWFCADEAGRVTDVNTIESTGLPSYDRRIARTMKSWRYQPYVIDTRAIRVCSVQVFKYQQR